MLGGHWYNFESLLPIEFDLLSLLEKEFMSKTPFLLLYYDAFDLIAKVIYKTDLIPWIRLEDSNDEYTDLFEVALNLRNKIF